MPPPPGVSVTLGPPRRAGVRRLRSCVRCSSFSRSQWRARHDYEASVLLGVALIAAAIGVGARGDGGQDRSDRHGRATRSDIVEATIWRAAERADRGRVNVARAGADVPRSHRPVRGPGERHRGDQRRARWTRPRTSIASAPPARCAARCTASRSASRTSSTRRACRRPAAAWPSPASRRPTTRTLVKNLRDAGAIIFAKTVLTEFANWVAAGMPANYSALFGYGYNPYDPRPIRAPALQRRPAGAGHRRIELGHRHGR